MQVSRLLPGLLSLVIAADGLAASSKEYTVLPADKLSWYDVKSPDGANLGLRSTDVWGHATRGAHGSLTLIPAGFQEPLHHHSNGVRVVVIKGLMRFNIREVETDVLNPGSFVFIAAEVPHFAHCVATVECEVLIEQDAAMDVKLDGK